MKIITISGLDGSGKSTQINLLKKYLESKGEKVFYFHTIEFGIAKKLVDLKNNFLLSKKQEKKFPSKSVTKANFFQVLARKICLIIDIIRFEILYQKLKKTGFNFILSDRYFYDTIINIYYLRNSQRKIPCEIVFKKADLAIYLQVDPKIIMQRDRKPEQGIEYLKTKKEFYDKKYAEWKMQLIDGNRQKEIILEDIKKLIF